MKIRFYLFLSLMGMLHLSCSETDSESVLSKDKLLGPYCGWDTSSTGNRSIVRTNIFESIYDNSKLMMNNFSGIGHDVEITLVHDKIIINPQSFEARDYAHGAAEWSYYTITVSGIGSYLPEDRLVTIDYTQDNGGEEENGRIEMINYKQYKASGTYQSEIGNEVIIENVNDSLFLSIVCFSRNGKYHWNNIIGFDGGCEISIPEQEVLENITGELQTLSGGGHKDENTLGMYIYLIPSTGQEIDNFRVTKEAENLP